MKKPTLLNQVNVNVDVTGQELIGPNTRRRGLIISAPSTNAVSVSFTGILPFPGGLILQPKGMPLVLAIPDMADAFQGPIFATSSLGTENIGVVELFA